MSNIINNIKLFIHKKVQPISVKTLNFIITMKKWPLINYVKRYYLLLLVVVASLFLASAKTPFLLFGTIVYLPLLASASMATALLIRHLFNNQSSDKDSKDGTYEREWDELNPTIRVILSVIQLIAYFWGVCYIASGLLK